MIEKLWGVATPLQHAAEQAVSERDLLFLGVARVCAEEADLVKVRVPRASHHEKHAPAEVKCRRENA